MLEKIQHKTKLNVRPKKCLFSLESVCKMIFCTFNGDYHRVSTHKANFGNQDRLKLVLSFPFKFRSCILFFYCFSHRKAEESFPSMKLAL